MVFFSISQVLFSSLRHVFNRIENYGYYRSLNAMQYKQLDSEAETQCTKVGISLNVSFCFFAFGMDSALAFHNIVFYETQETASHGS